MGIAVIAAQLILSLSILVILHEFGHFLPAKYFNTKVEKFYLFFDPWFALFKKKIGQTEYGVGWLPLGGYVKISGMIDESMDKEQMKQPPKPWEFRSKPAWQRLIIMLGGVTVNFILGFLLFAMVLFIWGEQYIKNEDAQYGIAVEELGEEMGLQDGDYVLSVGDLELEKFDDRAIFKEVVLNNANTLTVRRNGEIQEIQIPEDVASKLSSSESAEKSLFMPRAPFIIGEVKKDSPAEKAGIQVDDKIIGVNGSEIGYYDEFSEIVPDTSTQLALSVMRNNNELSFNLETTDKGNIGVYNKSLDYFFEISHKKYGFFEAIPAGVSKGYNFLSDQITAFGQMFTGKINPNESLGGFGSIAKLFPETWNWHQFWRITAVLSLILAFMNLLPIPALDGGHVMFLLYEVFSGRKPSDKFMEYATMVGFVILIALLLYANGLDVLRAFS